MASITSPKYGVKSVVTTGLLSEKQSFTWIINNFDIIRTSDELIKGQEFNFEAGTSIGLPTSWQFYLTFCERGEQYPKTKWISIFLELLNVPTNVEQVTVAFSKKCKKADEDGSKLCRHKLSTHVFDITGSDRGWGSAEFLKRDALLDDLPLVDGSLIIEVEFILYAVQPQDCVQILEIPITTHQTAFETKAIQKLIKDLGQTQALTGSNVDSVTKIVSKDDMEFPVNRGILSARSLVFQRMFQSEMKESETGVVRIDDLSGKTVRVLLHYLATGTLHEDWNSDEVIVELPYAAHKYDLKLLVDFLGDVLGSVCHRNTVKQLGIVARRLEMKTAERELFHYIINNAKCLEDVSIIA